MYRQRMLDGNRNRFQQQHLLITTMNFFFQPSSQAKYDHDRDAHIGTALLWLNFAIMRKTGATEEEIAAITEPTGEVKFKATELKIAVPAGDE